MTGSRVEPLKDMRPTTDLAGAALAAPPGIAATLTRAAALYGRGEYLWAQDWMGGEPGLEGYWRDLPKEEPARATGLCIAPLTQPLHDWAAANAPGGGNIPAARAFDKLALRAGFDESDLYLLLDGNLCVVDSMTGAIRWGANLGDEVRFCGPVPAPRGVGTDLVAGSDSGNLVRLSPAGERRWRLDLDVPITALSRSRRLVLVGTASGAVRAIGLPE